MTHPWHDVSYGKNAPNVIQAIIEVPKDSKLKYEVDKETGLIILDRPLYSSVHYPGDYGFIPQTYWEDGDPLDIIVISNFPVFPGVIVEARPIGVLHMEDEGEADDKIIAVHDTDPRFNHYQDLKDIPEHIKLEIKHFFETYKQLQNKKVKVLEFSNAKKAKECIKKGIKLYDEQIRKK